MKILITGGFGFIGCNAAARYIRRCDDVTVLDNMSRQGTDLNREWLKGVGDFRTAIKDAGNRQDIAGLFDSLGPFDIILHLAAQTAVTNSINAPEEDFSTNALGTLNLLEATRRSERDSIFLYSSTNKVYGDLKNIEITEGIRRYQLKKLLPKQYDLDFFSPYGCSKGCADQYVRDYARIYGMRTVVFRQSCIYGPRQLGVEDQGWVAWFIIACVFGKRITIYGNGKQVRDILYIDDLLDCYDSAIEQISSATGEIFDIGGGLGNSISLLELLDHISGLSGKKLSVVHSNWRQGDQRLYVSNLLKAKSILGWTPKITIKEGISRLYQWVKENLEFG